MYSFDDTDYFMLKENESITVVDKAGLSTYTVTKYTFTYEVSKETRVFKDEIIGEFHSHFDLASTM
jgi:hypothetical protein